ncbi:MAG: hypothetical protein HFH23_17245 [Ruminococcus sp.]|nr:hypothetical protein [Ruminococcus sp.]
MINGKKVSPERRGGRAEAGFLLVDVVCFCIVLAVVQIVSVALLEIRFTVNSPIEMFLEKVFCVLRFIFPQAILVMRTIPGAVVYYFIMAVLKKRA